MGKYLFDSRMANYWSSEHALPPWQQLMRAHGLVSSSAYTEQQVLLALCIIHGGEGEQGRTVKKVDDYR